MHGAVVSAQCRTDTALTSCCSGGSPRQPRSSVLAPVSRFHSSAPFFPLVPVPNRLSRLRGRNKVKSVKPRAVQNIASCASPAVMNFAFLMSAFLLKSTLLLSQSGHSPVAYNVGFLIQSTCSCHSPVTVPLHTRRLGTQTTRDTTIDSDSAQSDLMNCVP